MSRKKIITIAGRLGSGKSSTAKKVAERLGYQHFSSGDFLREVAVDRGVTITELMRMAETEPQIDHDIDEKLRAKGDDEELVIDSRLAYHWIPDSFKVYLIIDADVAAERMFTDLKSNPDRQKSEQYASVDEMKAKMLERFESDQKRYKDLYNIDHTSLDNYDLVIDTGKTENNLESVIVQVVDSYNEWLSE